ncbi:ribosomal protection-like ABC-F family protein [Limosilactobacillus sp.]|jgi:lincosamide and streptogramin A transport system ATP-binding/permease protein|uniref:ribosomal protection-like ABC-F family protein n=1 Tax=Limosilactobacillus sp. TaxID=2773925 RepID=UPI0025BCC848|nr:ABC-F type ribosomal protection protein [Limosilactobacillus sp.]MCH3921330.1 ABC-F type ribosomal protection protein [Limosilactobacillus sp.]MCH3928101.1 ABC-F type ribosomal protection protein [Limosilactobacillus sp.]
MGNISIRQLTFAYPGKDPLFDHSQIDIDGSWKLGLLGRNGRGKTTLMQILLGNRDYQGQITTNLNFAYFPQEIADPTDFAWNAINADAPQLEQWQVERELNLMGVDPALLWQPFGTLSGGEQTKVLLAALFADPASFPLLDEPTNHLDQHGRQQIADYLRGKRQGFIITSHDQDFLDRVIDHTLVIERHQLVLERGNYSTYFAQKQRRDQEAISTNEQLHADIKNLKAAKQQRLQWAQRAEGEKKHNSHADKGFIGAKAARMMKKSTAMARRLDKAADEKTGLLQEVETIVPLTINQQPSHQSPLLTLDDVSLDLPGRRLFDQLSLTVKQGEQVVLCGDNGTGKSSLFKAILGRFKGQVSGTITIAHNATISLVRQDYADFHGNLKQFAQDNRLEEDQLLNMLRKLGMERSSFTTPLDQLSMGQQKKVELARSLLTPAQLYLWDEPLNYLDTYNQDQLIQLIKRERPAMLIIEHDRHFIDEIATKRVTI